MVAKPGTTVRNPTNRAFGDKLRKGGSTEGGDKLSFPKFPKTYVEQ